MVTVKKVRPVSDVIGRASSASTAASTCSIHNVRSARTIVVKRTSVAPSQPGVCGVRTTTTLSSSSLRSAAVLMLSGRRSGGLLSSPGEQSAYSRSKLKSGFSSSVTVALRTAAPT